MYFKDCITSDLEWAGYEKLLTSLSAFLEDCVRHLMKALRVAEERAARDQKPHHITVMLLSRHVCEFIDGVAVLAGRGSAEACKPLLRSAYEALLSIYYIMSEDTERRALAYQVIHTHKRIKLYRKMMPSERAGQELRQTLQADTIGAGITLPQFDYQKMIDNLRGLFLKPEYASIDAEWQSMRGKKSGGSDPAWFSLFGGPPNVQRLAMAMKHGAWYEILYRQWSDAVHAGGILDNVSRSEDGRTVVKPVRHPEGLQKAVSLGAGICFSVARRLVQFYTPEREQEFKKLYIQNLRDRFLEVSSRTQIIKASWQ